MKHTHIKQIVDTVVDEVGVNITDTTSTEASDEIASGIQLVGTDVTSPAVKISEADEVTLTGTVVPSGHTHSINTLDITSSATENTIARRDTTGNIYSYSDNPSSNTGYLLANNNDLSTLFQINNTLNMTVENINVNSPSGNNVLTKLEISRVGNSVRLSRTYGWVCVCSSSPYCKCCC